MTAWTVKQIMPPSKSVSCLSSKDCSSQKPTMMSQKPTMTSQKPTMTSQKPTMSNKDKPKSGPCELPKGKEFFKDIRLKMNSKYRAECGIQKVNANLI